MRALRLWPLAATAHQVANAWRLLLVVLAVAILAATAITSLGLLSVTTEQSGVRASLTALPSSDTALEVDLTEPTAPIAKVHTIVDTAIQHVLGSDIPATSSVSAYTLPGPTERANANGGLAYFAQLDGVRDQAALVAGAWATDASVGLTSTVPVTLPATAASEFGLTVGSTFDVQVGVQSNFNTHVARTVRVVGIYRPTNPKSQFWSRDALHGTGFSPSFPVPDSLLQVRGNAFGPLVVGQGTLDASNIPVESLDFGYAPNFRATTVADLTPLITRLDGASDTVATSVGYVSSHIDYEASPTQPLKQIAANLIVTRSTVVVVILLLLVLAIAALLQTAQLLANARSGERQLLRARGASRRQIFILAVLEAVVIAIITAGMSPLLARLAYAIVARQPNMIAARMPTDAGLPPLAFELAAGVGVLFAIVLLAPLLTRPGTFIDGIQASARERRGAGLVRSGLDLGVVVVAVVLFWQLQSYRSPVGGVASLAIDPVLVAAPAVILLAAALIAARLVPLLARAAASLGDRFPGAVVPLAVWEISRRSQRTVAAILLLTIAVSVGTFGTSFLATWRQSQVDQASLAVGPPVRVPSIASRVDAESVLLAKGAIDTPQPVLRRIATVAGQGATAVEGEPPDGPDAVVLGMTASARDMTDSGRLASDGGARVASLLSSRPVTTTSILLPGAVLGLTARVQVGTPASAIPGVSTSISAIIEDGNGLFSTVALGSVPVDGEPHGVSGLLPTSVNGIGAVLPLRFVGFQAFVFESDRAAYGQSNPEVPANILMGHLAVLHAVSAKAAADGDFTSVPVAPAKGAEWFADGADVSGHRPTTGAVPEGWQLRLNVVIPAALDQNSGTFVLMGWSPIVGIPAVFSTGLAKTLSARKANGFTLVFANSTVSITLAGTTPLVPGSVDYSNLTPGTVSGADGKTTNAVVVDLPALERALAQVGQSGSPADEWWVDVAPGSGQRYLDAHGTTPPALPPVSREVLGQQMQDDPLRIATQAALWLAIAAAGILAAVGFAVHTAAAMRSRRVEFAQLRAVGLARRRLVALVAVESLALSVVGTAFGIGVGALLSVLTVALVAVSPDGTPAVPGVVVLFPVAAIGLLVLAIFAVLAVIVLVVAGDQRRISPADILRGGGD